MQVFFFKHLQKKVPFFFYGKRLLLIFAFYLT